MNKKSKIKTTLDSLFTGGRIKPEEVNIEEENKALTPKPTTAETSIKPTQPVKKVSDPKKENSKPVENVSPEEPKPIQEKLVVTPSIEISEQTFETKKGVSVEEIPPETVTKSPELKQTVIPVEKSKTDAEKVQRIAAEIDMAKTVKVDDDEHLVIFTLGKELYGVTIHSVESIIKIQAITEVPRAASFVLGVTNLRGTVVPVLDLRKRFNLQFTDNTPNTRIIIVNAEGSKVGIVVDEVTEVLKVAQHSIQPPPPMSTTIESAFISGIAKINDRLVILLDLEKVLSSSSRQFNR